MKTIFLSIALATLIIACTPTATDGPTVTIQPTAWQKTAGTLWVRILSPTDEAIVNTPSVEVRGEAPAETIISINDDILIVPTDQTFSLFFELDEGLNVIEIVASDYEGNEISFIITVTYQP